MIVLFEILAFWLVGLFVASILTYRLKWAALCRKNQLPDILLKPHADWPRGFRRVPRTWFAWLGEPPKMIVGTAEGHLDITAPGTWALCWPLFVTLRTSGGWHARAGFRYDYNDHYYQLSATVKKP